MNQMNQINPALMGPKGQPGQGQPGQGQWQPGQGQPGQGQPGQGQSGQGQPGKGQPGQGQPGQGQSGQGQPGQQGQDTYILFFHENSNACQKLKPHIPKDKSIQVVNVEHLQTIPPSITSIPSLVINNNKILKGKEVFDYFTKSDEMEYINFSGKNTGFSFSNLDNDLVESTGTFSSIDNMEYTGVPTWEDKDSNEQLDMDRLQANRDEMMKNIQDKR